jgi:hypothetical protein
MIRSLLRLARTWFEILRGPVEYPWLLLTEEEKRRWRSDKRLTARRQSEVLMGETKELARRSRRIARDSLAVQVVGAFLLGVVALLVVVGLL